MKMILISMLLLLTGCSTFQNDLTMFREEAIQCPGHVTLDVVQEDGKQTLRVQCEWGQTTTPPPQDVPFEEAI